MTAGADGKTGGGEEGGGEGGVKKQQRFRRGCALCVCSDKEMTLLELELDDEDEHLTINH